MHQNTNCAYCSVWLRIELPVNNNPGSFHAPIEEYFSNPTCLYKTFRKELHLSSIFCTVFQEFATEEPHSHTLSFPWSSIEKNMEFPV